MGIEAQYLQRVFGLFEKLTPASEGTGIGLALIKRIIEVHGAGFGLNQMDWEKAQHFVLRSQI